MKTEYGIDPTGLAEVGPASLKLIREELKMLKPVTLINICLHLARYKKENKELLTYLLFEAQDEQAYIRRIKANMDEQFKGLNSSSLYLQKKALQKIIRATNKYIKYSKIRQTEVELRIYFCQKTKAAKLPLHKNKVLENIYQRQINKIRQAMSLLHEDLQHDYSEELKPLL